MDEVIRVSGLMKSYAGRTVVREVSLTVGRGEVFGLLGANGAGKTTSVECMVGVRVPDAGMVEILGMNPRRDRKRLFEQVGVQFQETSYQAEIRVGELCRETACLYDQPLDWRVLLERFGLGGREGTQAKSLSGGQRQRLFIVLALIGNPRLVFLDELTTGLDVKARRDVWRTLEQLKRDGLTIFLTSHFMDEVEVLCDRVGILRDGNVAFLGTIAQAIEASPCETFEAAYLWFAGEEEVRDDEVA